MRSSLAGTFAAAALVVAVLSTRAVSAGTIEVPYRSVEGILVTEVLTDGGRYYLQGDAEETCAYAFVQEPRVSAADGRLVVRFLFAGRAGTVIAGRCVGAGDNFDVVVSGVPRYEDGEIYLDELRFDAENVLFEAFALLIERQLTPRLRLPFERALASRIAAWSTSGTGSIVLTALDVERIRLGESSVVVEADYEVAFEPDARSSEK